MTIHLHSVSFISIHGNGWDDSRNEGGDVTARYTKKKPRFFWEKNCLYFGPPSFCYLLSSEAVEALTAARAAS